MRSLYEMGDLVYIALQIEREIETGAVIPVSEVYPATVLSVAHNFPWDFKLDDDTWAARSPIKTNGNYCGWWYFIEFDHEEMQALGQQPPIYAPPPPKKEGEEQADPFALKTEVVTELHIISERIDF